MLDLTVVAGSRAVKEDLPVENRPGKVILLADGTLHADWGPKIGWESRPGTTRVLRREQVTEVWSLLKRLGFADRSKGEAPVNLELVHPTPQEVIHHLVLRVDDDSWRFTQTNLMDEDPPGAFSELIRALAALAWEPDQEISEATIVPIRYDFGPDPYARYRKQPESQPDEVP